MEAYVFGCLFLTLLLRNSHHCDAGPVDTENLGANCRDFKQRPVQAGERFIPSGTDTCMFCVCINGRSEMCSAMLCQFPCPNYVTVEDKCCEFICLDGSPHPMPPSNVTVPDFNDDLGPLATTNIGLRLVASTVTSFLILALLLFLIHRLRQRRLLLMLRRLNGGQMRSESYGARRFSYDEDGSVGYLTGQEHVDFNFYEDPPPPYTFWKPPESYFPQEEAPPPYEPCNIISNRQIPREYVVPTSAVMSIPNEPYTVGPNLAPNCTQMSTFLSPTADTVSHFQLNDLDQESEDRCPRHSVPIQDLNVVGSLSSLTSAQSDSNESQLATRTSGSTDVVIPSDATYEDLLPSAIQMRNGGSCGEQRAFKCHSCSDVVISWKPCVEKRRSLQPGCDLTTWNLDATESSSSSSPSYERTTLSPTSSDSSSICGFNFEPDITNFEANKTSTRRAVSSGVGASSSSSKSISASANDRGTKCPMKKTRPSKLRQILESFNTNSTITKKASMKDKKGLMNKRGLDEGGGAGAVAKEDPSTLISGFDAGVTYRTPRILYVSDCDELRKSLNVPTSERQALRPKTAVKKCQMRPHSYDFGDLNTAGTSAMPTNGGDSTDEVTNNSNRNPSECLVRSFDSFTCTCSSQASFGSELMLQSSSTFHSQEGLAVSPDCSSLLTESPGSPQLDFEAANRWKDTRLSKVGQQNAISSHSSRLPNQQIDNETISASEHSRSPQPALNDTRLRVTLDYSKGSHESYI